MAEQAGTGRAGGLTTVRRGGLRRPRWSAEDTTPERHASWLELFFDLVFVVAVAELAHILEVDLTPGGLLVFTALFVPVWWQWIDFSYFADQFDQDGTRFQWTFLGIMFGIIVLAVSLGKAAHGESIFFAATYIALRVVIVALYGWAWRNVPDAREIARRYTLSFTVALGVWIVSLFVPPPARYAVWALALAIEISNGPITYATLRQVRAQVSHMDERFGLFVILVLGEAVISVSTAVAEVASLWQTWLVAFGGFVIAVGMWLLYFRRADPAVINRALRGDARARIVSFVYGYSHFFIFAGITAAGIGVQAAILAAGGEEWAPGASLALAGGAGAFLLALAAVQWATPHSLEQRALATRLVAGGGCLVLALFGAALPPLLLVSLVALALVAVALLDSLAAQYETAVNEPEPTA